MNEPHEDSAAIARAMDGAAEALRDRNRRMGWPLVVWREGRVQYVDPHTLQPIAWPEGVCEEPAASPLPPTS